MITVRYPNGQAISYNDATYLVHGVNEWILYKDKDKKYQIAFIQASAGIIVEFYAPCSVRNPIRSHNTAEFQELAKEVRSLKRFMLKRKDKKK